MGIEPDSIFIKVGDEMHSWQIRREASAKLPAVLEITKVLRSDLSSLPPAADTIFRTFLEWEIADSIADQKEYSEHTDQIENYYNKKLERVCKEGGYQSLFATSHVFSPLREVASLLTQTYNHNRFDPETRQDLHLEIAKQVAEFRSRERNFHPLEQQLQLGPPKTESLTLPEKDLQFLEQVQEGLIPRELQDWQALPPLVRVVIDNTHWIPAAFALTYLIHKLVEYNLRIQQPPFP